MIAYVTFITTMSSVPLQNRVMFKTDSHSDLITTIGKMADQCAKDLESDNHIYSVACMELKRVSSPYEDLHYRCTISLSAEEKEEEHDQWDDLWHDEWESHEFGDK